VDGAAHPFALTQVDHFMGDAGLAGEGRVCTSVFVKKPDRLVIFWQGWFFDAVRIKRRPHTAYQERASRQIPSLFMLRMKPNVITPCT